MGITIKENFPGQAPVINQLFKSNFLFTSGVIIVVGWILIAIFAGVLAPADPIAQDMAHRFEPPSMDYWCGTDELGRDILSRVLVGARLSLTAGLVATTIGALLPSSMVRAALALLRTNSSLSASAFSRTGLASARPISPSAYAAHRRA